MCGWWGEVWFAALCACQTARLIDHEPGVNDGPCVGAQCMDCSTGTCAGWIPEKRGRVGRSGFQDLRWSASWCAGMHGWKDSTWCTHPQSWGGPSACCGAYGQLGVGQ